MGDFLTIDSGNLQADVDQVIVGELGQIGPNTERKLVRTEQRLIDELISRTRAKASNDVLQVRSGRLSKSFHGSIYDHGSQGLGTELLAALSTLERARLDDRDQSVTATVYSTDPIFHVLEFGATLPPREIDVNTAHAMAFLSREGISFAERVHFPSAEIKPHPTLHAAFAEMEMEIITALEQAAAPA